jgi:hypothetical protein
MPSDQVVVYCNNCKKNTVQIKQRTNHILHLILTLVTFGFWIIVWFFIAMSTNDTPQCTVCGNQLNISSSNQSNKQETKYKKDAKIKKGKISKLLIFFIILVILYIIGFLVPDNKNKSTSKTENKKEIEEKQKGLHCLRGWDGSSRELVDYVKKNMRDPDSFKHRETRIGPNINNTHFIHMMYSGKNGFGGVTVEGVSGKLSSDCKLIEVNAK